MENILQGSLRHFSLPEVLNFLTLGKKSGTLNLTDPVRHTAIYFTEGSVAYAFSNQEQFRLGLLLLRKKKISKAQRQQLEELMLHEGERFGHAALDQKLFTPDQMHDFLKTHVSEIVYDALRWDGGVFALVDGAPPPAVAVPLKLDLPAILAEGAMHNEEWTRCLTLLPNAQAVYYVVGDPETQGKITLSLDQWKVLFKIDGTRTLEELVREAEEEPIEVYRIIYELLSNGLIAEVTDENRAAVAGASPAQKSASPITAAQPVLPPAIPEPPAMVIPPPQAAAPSAPPKPAPEPPRPKLSLEEAPAKAAEPPAAPKAPEPMASKPSAPTSAGNVPMPPGTHPGDRTAPMAAQPAPPEVAAAPAPPPPAPAPVAPLPEPTIIEGQLSMTVACLTLENAERTSFPLYENEYLVGREAGNNIQIPDGSVSATHARIVLDDGGYVIEDLKSRNGTYVNGERVDRKLLRENDKVRLGKVLLTYNVASELKQMGATMFQPPSPRG